MVANVVTVSDATADEARYQHLLEVEQAIAILHQTARARVKELVERFDPDLQPAGFGVLRYIVANCPIRAGDIAAALSIDKSAVSRQLTVLRDSGFIETRADPNDGRATLLVATPAARDALDSFREAIKADYARVLSTWSTSDIETFGSLLQRFNRSVI
jgi:DNA-binding MarR family transcriptional regulator